MRREVLIAPSILSADFSKLATEIKSITKAGADWIHIDVMDGHYVPNITFGPKLIQDIRPHSALPFDAHLMISPIDCYLESFIAAGADIVTVHPEASPHIHRTLQTIKTFNKKAGIALNPGTPIQHLAPLLDLVDVILIMTVNPGFGGQAFIENQIEKIKEVRKLIDASNRQILLEVDGGINPTIASAVIDAGADVLVAGNSVFKNSDYASNIKKLRNFEENKF